MDSVLVPPLGPDLAGLVQLVDEVVHAEQQLDTVDELRPLVQHLDGGPLPGVVVPAVLVVRSAVRLQPLVEESRVGVGNQDLR